MRIGAKNSTPARIRKRFLALCDAGKGFISSVCATRVVLSRRARARSQAPPECENALKTRLDAH
jgi:hypothetical protein